MGGCRRRVQGSFRERETPQALAGLGEALWWLCDARGSVRSRERAFVKFREVGDLVSASRVAVDLSISYLLNFGNRPAAQGWLARAERVMAEVNPNRIEGWILLMQGFLETDPARAYDFLDRALGRARDSGDVDLELVALGDLGLAMVRSGAPEEGIKLLDEAMAGTLGGEYKRLDTVVFTSCNMLAACQYVGDLRRATQWCRVADDFMTRYSCPFLFARCRVHYGSLLVAKGQWSRADKELRAALRTSQDAGPGPRFEALVGLAELRSHQGRVEEAEALLAESDDVLVPLPAARLALARGEAEAAAALLGRRLEQLGDSPVEAPATLALLVDALLACRDLPGAEKALARLEASAVGRDYAAAHAARASAHLASAKGEWFVAIDRLEVALALFVDLDLPLEAARVRLDLARAFATERAELAVVEARRALTAFEQLGAQPDADATAALLRSLGTSGRAAPRKLGVLTKREQEVLELVGIGLSNPEIAQRLFISRKTAAHHVSSLLAKLGLRNRAEAVAYAAHHPARHDRAQGSKS